jgi:HK97 family phage major capsid protein
MEHLIKEYRSLTDELKKINSAVESEKRGFSDAENSRLAEINKRLESLTRDIDAVKAGNAAINRADEFERALKAPPAKYKPDYSKRDLRDMARFSLARAISLKSQGLALDGIEAEVMSEGEKEMRAVGVEPQQTTGSFIVPRTALNIMALQKRTGNDITATGQIAVAGDAGGQLIQTDVMQPLNMLFNPQVFRDLGVRFIEGLEGQVKLPRPGYDNTTIADPSFATEIGNAGQAQYKFDSVSLSPKPLTTYINISKQEMKQVPYVQEFVVSELTTQLMSYLEKAAINGATNGMTGLLATTNLPAYTLADATNFKIAWDDLVGMEANVENFNALQGNLGYLTNPSVKKLARKTPKLGTTFPVYLYEDGELGDAGYKCAITPNVPSNLGATTNRSALIFGNWRDFVVGLWGGLEVIVNPWILDINREVRVSFNLYCDAQVLRLQSFAAATTIAA